MSTIRTNESFNDNEYKEGDSSFLSRAEEFYRVITGFWTFLQIREAVLFLVRPPSPFPEIQQGVSAFVVNHFRASRQSV